MQYEVEVNGRIRRVFLERTGGRFVVSVDGRTRQVDVARAGDSGGTAGNSVARTLSLIVEPGATFDVGIVPDAATGLLSVRVGACLVCGGAEPRTQAPRARRVRPRIGTAAPRGADARQDCARGRHAG